MQPVILHYPDGDLLAGVVTRVRVIRDLRAKHRKVRERVSEVNVERYDRDSLFILQCARAASTQDLFPRKEIDTA